MTLPYFLMMSAQSIVLTVTSKGQVTLKRAVLDHMGAAPGDCVIVEMLPRGRVAFSAAPRGPISGLVGILKRDGEAALTVKEMDDAVSEAFAAER